MENFTCVNQCNNNKAAGNGRMSEENLSSNKFKVDSNFPTNIKSVFWQKKAKQKTTEL